MQHTREQWPLLVVVGDPLLQYAAPGDCRDPSQPDARTRVAGEPNQLMWRMQDLCHSLHPLLHSRVAECARRMSVPSCVCQAIDSTHCRSVARHKGQAHNSAKNKQQHLSTLAEHGQGCVKRVREKQYSTLQLKELLLQHEVDSKVALGFRTLSYKPLRCLYKKERKKRHQQRR